MGLPTMAAMASQVRRTRAKFAPPREFKLFFDIDYAHIPNGFLQRDMVIGDNLERYILLGTFEQIGYFFNAKNTKFEFSAKTHFLVLYMGFRLTMHM